LDPLKTYQLLITNIYLFFYLNLRHNAAPINANSTFVNRDSSTNRISFFTFSFIISIPQSPTTAIPKPFPIPIEINSNNQESTEPNQVRIPDPDLPHRGLLLRSPPLLHPSHLLHLVLVLFIAIFFSFFI
jgi:hypothetical protein